MSVYYSSFVITDPSIQMVPRLMISAARHARGVRTVLKEGLLQELTVILVKVPSPSSPIIVIIYLHLNLLSCLPSPWMPESTSFNRKWTRTR